MLAAGLSGCGADAGEDDTPDRRAFSFGGETLRIEAVNTDIELVPADVKEVEVTRWFSGWTAVGGSVEKTWAMEGSTLRLDVDCDGVLENCDSRHRVRVPRGVAVTVEGDNGHISAKGFASALTLRSDNGAVRVEDIRGALELESDNGRVDATGIASRQVSAVSDNGQVRLGFAEAPDLVDVESDNGSVRIELPPRSSYKIDAESDNGSIDIGVPRDDLSEHSVSARSQNGEITIGTAN